MDASNRGSETSNGKDILDQKRRNCDMGRDDIAIAATPATVGRIPQQEVNNSMYSKSQKFLVLCSKDYLSCSPPLISFSYVND
jgi:hypothetical protein